MLKLQTWVLLLILGILICFGLINIKQHISLADDPQVLHIVNRLSFGPRPGEIDKIQSTGIEAYIQSQLSPESIQELPKLTGELNELETLQMTPVQLFTEYSPIRQRQRQQMSQEERKMMRKRMRKVVQQAIQ